MLNSKSVFQILISLFLYAQSFGQIGDAFPLISGETLLDKEISIPADVNGKYTLIGMAYSQKAEDDLKTWYIPAYNKFIAKTGFMDDMYNVNLYFVPMFSGAKRMAKPKAMKEMEKNSDEKLHPYVIFYSGEIKEYQQRLEMNKKNIPYFFLIDPDGKIAWSATGSFEQSYFDKIESILSE